MVVFMDGIVTVEQGGEANDLRPSSRDGLDELLRRHVGAQVDDLEPAPFEQGGDQVLADVVQVSLHGADGDGARRLGPALGQQAGGAARASPSWPAPRGAVRARSTPLASNRLPTSSIAGTIVPEISFEGSMFSAIASLVMATAVLASPLSTAS